jgi:hypothetical protein
MVIGVRGKPAFWRGVCTAPLPHKSSLARPLLMDNKSIQL